ncbi:hypothetical protein AB1L30_17335 [Bremerella sp. JC817]|uniref:hypothetical protein n=1 Tax=Bremerella sp. JC817 TaxID=3231756 RepID=UPI00345A87E1
MTTPEFNPYASPEADQPGSDKPEADTTFPLQATAIAQIEEVPAPYAGKVRTLVNRFMVGLANVMIRLPIVGAVYFLIRYAPEWMNLGGLASLALTAMVIGVFTVVFLLINALCEDRWWEVMMRRQVDRRPSPWIVSDTYRSQFVTLTSSKPQAMASFQLGTNDAEIIDIGLLRLDHETGEIILECDLRRYRIPRASLLACDVRQITLHTPWTPVVRIACETLTGPSEFCILASDTNPWRIFVRRYRRKRAEEIAEEIYSLPNIPDEPIRPEMAS